MITWKNKGVQGMALSGACHANVGETAKGSICDQGLPHLAHLIPSLACGSRAAGSLCSCGSGHSRSCGGHRLQQHLALAVNVHGLLRRHKHGKQCAGGVRGCCRIECAPAATPQQMPPPSDPWLTVEGTKRMMRRLRFSTSTSVSTACTDTTFACCSEGVGHGRTRSVAVLPADM